MIQIEVNRPKATSGFVTIWKTMDTVRDPPEAIGAITPIWRTRLIIVKKLLTPHVYLDL